MSYKKNKLSIIHYLKCDKFLILRLNKTFNRKHE
jgi:hypothetical protein